MKVLVLSTVFPNPAQPATGIFVRERVRRLAGHCDVEVVAPVAWFPLNDLIRGRRVRGIPRHEVQGRLSVHHPRFFSVPRFLKCLDGAFYALSLAPFLWRLRGRFRFEVIDAHFAYPDGLAAALLGKLFRCPVVITLRGSIVRLTTYRTHRPQIRWALRRASRVLAVSASLKATAVALGIPPDKIRVIPNGVDTGRFTPQPREEARRSLGISADRTVLLSVGGLNVGKGHHRIVDVLPRLLPRHPSLLYVIVGGERAGDSSRPLIERVIARHRLQQHVLFAGERPHDEIPRWLAAADVFCLATRSEGWANVLLEALACGRPVVATRVGGNAEIVADETLGLLVPPADDDALAAGIAAALERTWDVDRLVAYARGHGWEASALHAAEELAGTLTCPRPARVAVSSAAGGER